MIQLLKKTLYTNFVQAYASTAETGQETENIYFDVVAAKLHKYELNTIMRDFNVYDRSGGVEKATGGFTPRGRKERGERHIKISQENI